MTEPEYIYVKGEGWIPFSGFIATSADGKRCYILPRNPNIGEFFISRSGSTMWKINDKLNLPAFSNVVSITSKVGFRKYTNNNINLLSYSVVTLHWID